MPRSNRLSWLRTLAIRSYGIAVLSVAAVVIVLRWPPLHLQQALASLFLCAILLSAWFGGARPGLLAAGLSVLAYYYFLSPTGSLDPKPAELPRLFVFAATALFVWSLSAAQRSTTESLRRARDDLKVRVQEIQQTNAALQGESRERIQTENRLRRSEAYLQEAQTLGRIGSWVIDVAAGTVSGSPELFRIFGRDPGDEQLTKEMLRDVRSMPIFRTSVHPEDLPFVEEFTTKAASEAKAGEIEYRIVLLDGSVKYVHSVAHPVLDNSGKVVEYIGTIMDVTERKRSEEALRQAYAELAHISRVTTMGELTASLAHEVNQPIAAAVTSANSCIHWLAGDVPNLDKARASALRIVKDGTRAAEIISRIRLLFQKGILQLERIEVNEVIEEMIVLLHGEATRYSISVRTELAADLPPVMGDRVQLQQVVMNLMANGIDAMKSVDGTRELVIKSQRAENEVLTVSISDTGVGLPPQQGDQIFNAFFTTKPHGTGMGLRICRSIVESHGGRLWATDNSPRGASFHFALSTKMPAKELNSTVNS